MVKVNKVINNNLIRSYDENHREVLVMGRGIGFKKKPGDIVDDSLVEKVYRIEDKGIEGKLGALLSEIPAEHIRVANLVIDYAKQTMSNPLNDTIYISLTDHLNFAIERAEKGQALKFGLLWEIQKYYNGEYQIGLESIEIVKRELGIELPVDEAGFIAIHLVEASMNGSTTEVVEQSMAMIKEILSIVQYHYGIELDEHSLAYERFMVHLKFFITRALKQEPLTDDSHLYQVLEPIYKNDFACCEKIRTFFAKTMGFYIPDAEIVYLAIHLHRITESNEKERE